jgi:hypothetical protein
VFYYGKRVVEMMQQRLPALVRLGSAKALGVILEAPPATELIALTARFGGYLTPQVSAGSAKQRR